MATRNKDVKSQRDSLSLRALIVEDNPRDVKLMVAMIERGGYQLTFDFVDTPDLFKTKLQQTPDHHRRL